MAQKPVSQGYKDYVRWVFDHPAMFSLLGSILMALLMSAYGLPILTRFAVALGSFLIFYAIYGWPGFGRKRATRRVIDAPLKKSDGPPSA